MWETARRNPPDESENKPPLGFRVSSFSCPQLHLPSSSTVWSGGSPVREKHSKDFRRDPE